MSTVALIRREAARLIREEGWHRGGKGWQLNPDGTKCRCLVVAIYDAAHNAAGPTVTLTDVLDVLGDELGVVRVPDSPWLDVRDGWSPARWNDHSERTVDEVLRLLDPRLPALTPTTAT